MRETRRNNSICRTTATVGCAEGAVVAVVVVAYAADVVAANDVAVASVDDAVACPYDVAVVVEDAAESDDIRNKFHLLRKRKSWVEWTREEEEENKSPYEGAVAVVVDDAVAVVVGFRGREMMRSIEALGHNSS